MKIKLKYQKKVDVIAEEDDEELDDEDEDIETIDEDNPQAEKDEEESKDLNSIAKETEP